MSPSFLDAEARHVLSHYPPPLGQGRLVPMVSHRGFSGARLWRLEGPLGALCLRAWPPGDPSPEHLSFIHRLMRRAEQAGLQTVPVLFATARGDTWVEHDNRLWELTAWMPGRADYHDRPTPQRLRAACRELARLHAAWADALPPATGPCPAVERRLRRAHEWKERIASGWRPAFVDDPVRPWAERAWQLLPILLKGVPRLLAPWAARPVALQPCLCDIWDEHVLYEGDQVTGLIDYGGVKVDHVSVDLARLLGSMAEDDPQGWVIGMEAYAALKGLSPEEEGLARVLDQTGVVIGAATWLRWLYLEGRVFEDRSAAAERLAALVRRMERREAGGFG